MDSVRFIFFLLLYVAVTSTLIAIFASGIAGVSSGAYGEGLVNYTAPDQDSFLDGIPFLGETADAASMVSSFLMALAGVLFWTLPAEIMPLWANLIFIKIPLIALIVSVIEVLLP